MSHRRAPGPPPRGVAGCFWTVLTVALATMVVIVLLKAAGRI